MNNKLLQFHKNSQHDLVPDNARNALSGLLFEYIEKIKKDRPDILDPLFSARNKEEQQKIMHFASALQNDPINLILLLGIGGSQLGPSAIIKFLCEPFFNESSPKTLFYTADTVDSPTLAALHKIVEAQLKNKKRVLLLVVSKSGTTLETIANFSLFFELLRQYKKERASQDIVILSEEESPLWNFGVQQKTHLFPLPKLIGGRYSIFTAVGILPAQLLGVNIDSLCTGAEEMLTSCLSLDDKHNNAVYRAVTLFYWYSQNYFIHDIFPFSLNCISLAFWYRQLIAESLGKKRNSDKTSVGITPIVSVGSRDLHSLFQLSIDGPHRTITTFLIVDEEQTNREIPLSNYLSSTGAEIISSTSKITNALSTATMNVYQEKKLPFLSIELKERSPYILGQLFQCFMMETVFLAQLLEVNPFDQPAVELYKRKSKQLLNL